MEDPSIKWFTREVFRNAVYPRLEKGRNAFHDQTIDQLEAFWTPNESMTSIKEDFKNFPLLPQPVQFTVSSILHFLFAADAYASQLTTETLTAEYEDIVSKGMLATHGFMEIIHAQAYGIIIEIPYGGAVPLEVAYQRVADSPAVRRMLKWGHSYTEPNLPHMDRLVGLLSYELLVFTPLFMFIIALKSRNVLPAICTTNELVARDELKHGNNVLILINYQRGKGVPLNEEHVKATFHAAMLCANSLIIEALPEDLPEWNLCKQDASDYTKRIANAVLAAMQFTPMYKVDSEVPGYMAKLGMGQFTSFHSERPSEYKRPMDVEDCSVQLSESQLSLLQAYD